jgi:hypothetical protein
MVWMSENGGHVVVLQAIASPSSATLINANCYRYVNLLFLI